MQFDGNISTTTNEITTYVAKLDTAEQKKLLRALKLREAKLLAIKLNSNKIETKISIDEICETIRKVRKSNAKLQSR